MYNKIVLEHKKIEQLSPVQIIGINYLLSKLYEIKSSITSIILFKSIYYTLENL